MGIGGGDGCVGVGESPTKTIYAIDFSRVILFYIHRISISVS